MEFVSTTLPFPVLRHILLTADPVSLFKITTINSFIRSYAFKLRGLPIDTLIITPTTTSTFSFPKRTHSLKPYLHTDKSGKTELRLKCSILQLKTLKVFEKVKIWNNVILKNLTDEVADVIDTLKIQKDCNLTVKNCELSTKVWRKVLKVKWNGFECDSKQPPIETITANLLHLETMKFVFFVF